MNDDHPLLGILLIVLLITLKAIITRAKIAFKNADIKQVGEKSDEGAGLAKVFKKMLDQEARLNNTFNLINIGISFIIALVFFNLIVTPIAATMLVNERPAILVFLISFIFVFLLLYLASFFGYILPGGLNINKKDTFAYKFVPLIYLFYLVFMPLTFIMEKTMNAICKLFGLTPYGQGDNVTEEEIISLVHEGKEQGVFMDSEVEMISNIIELNDKEAQGIMTHKKKIVMISNDQSVEEAIQIMLDEGFSRYPLYEGNQDNILGILHLKDTIRHLLAEEKSNKVSLEEIAREAYFVPDTQNISVLFREMQSKSIHMAIAIDEYGQTAGLVAMEDILEEIVGDIWDEYDVEEKMIIHKGRNFSIVLGAISLEELEDDLGIIIENEDFDTLNGLLISRLDRIPQDGESATVNYQGYRFDILVTLNRMIEKVRISKIEE